MLFSYGNGYDYFIFIYFLDVIIELCSCKIEFSYHQNTIEPLELV